uniref:Oligoribonuclease, mitochondrial n=1 Tax=Xiphophorus couchianus TaxID=32473 RepID=A0A3B5MLF0_9TELE
RYFLLSAVFSFYFLFKSVIFSFRKKFHSQYVFELLSFIYFSAAQIFLVIVFYFYSLKMTGLDVEKDQIIEMACIITDSDLNIIAEGPSMIINQPDELLDGMSDWCKEHHGKSGLIQAVQNSKMTLEQAEYEFLSFVRQHTPPGQCPLAGNSVHADKRFLDKYMPQFMYHLHYRIIDVSTIKELCRRWFPEEFKMAPHKSAAHRALDDIKESIKELQYYRASIFKAPSEEKKHKIIGNSGNKRS